MKKWKPLKPSFIPKIKGVGAYQKSRTTMNNQRWNSNETSKERSGVSETIIKLMPMTLARETEEREEQQHSECQ